MCKPHAQTFSMETEPWWWWDAYRKAESMLRTQCLDFHLFTVCLCYPMDLRCLLKGVRWQGRVIFISVQGLPSEWGHHDLDSTFLNFSNSTFCINCKILLKFD